MAKDMTALMGVGTEYQGTMNFKGTVRIEGRFLGTINSDGKLVLSKGAYVEGNITVGELEVHGTLHGEIVVLERTLLHQTAKVTGTLSTPIMAMEQGAFLQGKLSMSKEAEESKEALSSSIVSDKEFKFIEEPVEQ